MPTVSVIIPTHNRSRLLRRAIESARQQTFDDLEIIVVDDASSDDTTAMMEAYRDPRIRYLKLQHNVGVADARNAGLAAASGALIALLDDDDEWLPDKLRSQVAAFERARPDVGAVYSGYRQVDQTTSAVLAERRPELRGRVFDEMLRAGGFMPTSTIVVRAECFRRLGGFDPAFRYGEDYDMWLRIAREYEFAYVDECLTNVYYQPTGLTQNFAAVISGTELHLARYREFFASRGSLYSAQLRRLGTFYCFAGDVGKARSMFVSAIRRDPWAAKNYASLLLSFTGAAAFRGVYLAKDRLFA